MSTLIRQDEDEDEQIDDERASDGCKSSNLDIRYVFYSKAEEGGRSRSMYSTLLESTYITHMHAQHGDMDSGIFAGKHLFFFFLEKVVPELLYR